jgi:hypothetical protein
MFVVKPISYSKISVFCGLVYWWGRHFRSFRLDPIAAPVPCSRDYTLTSMNAYLQSCVPILLISIPQLSVFSCKLPGSLFLSYVLTWHHCPFWIFWRGTRWSCPQATWVGAAWAWRLSNQNPNCVLVVSILIRGDLNLLAVITACVVSPPGKCRSQMRFMLSLHKARERVSWHCPLTLPPKRFQGFRWNLW